jgi:hypothetical protein
MSGGSSWNKLTDHQCRRSVPGTLAEYNANRRKTLKSKRRKRVCFNLEANQVQLITSLVDPTNGTISAIDLWWSSEEMHASRCDGKLDAVTQESAHDYCRAYERAHRQVHTARKLSSANLAELVTGLALGHRGLEQNCSTKRKCAIYSHVASVIQCHRDNMVASFDSLEGSSKHSHGSTLSGSTLSGSTTHSPTRNISLDRMVRNHSAKLSAGNRHFAVALGRAQHLAADLDDNQSPVA